MNVRPLIIALALLAPAPAAFAQDSTLDRIQNLIATGRLTEARNTLDQWEKQHAAPESTPSDDRARALFLGGLLTTDAKAAEDAFIGVVLSYPSSPVAPEALLRLGQSLHTAGETQRAITYLERLRYDYPRASQRETGMLWLARAQLAIGQAAAACGTARETLLGTSNDNVRTLLELERDRACEASGGIADGPPPPVTSRLPDLGIAVDTAPGHPVRTDTAAAPAPVAEPAREPALEPAAEPARTDDVAPAAPANTTASTTPGTTAAGPEYAVQTAAFSERRAAETIVAELRAKGFDARIVTVPGSPYFRVRHGMFSTNRQAAAAALRIRDAGFATLVVNDVRLERRH